jgi:hypothetical protein
MMDLRLVWFAHGVVASAGIEVEFRRFVCRHDLMKRMCSVHAFAGLMDHDKRICLALDGGELPCIKLGIPTKLPSLYIDHPRR